MQDAPFEDTVLTQLYDLQNRWAIDDDFFLALANELPGSHILDLGCGTGRLTIALAGAGHRVTGVDPAGASLDAARNKPGAARVTWLEGTSSILPTAVFDLALMTSHVAQFIVSDSEWAATLADLRRALRPGGRLAFDSRDPASRGWENWNSDEAGDRLVLPDGRSVTVWTRVTGVAGDQASGPTVTLVEHLHLVDSGRELAGEETLRFRSEQQVRSSLNAAGFDLEHFFGGWRGEPVGQGVGEFVVVARRRE